MTSAMLFLVYWLGSWLFIAVIVWQTGRWMKSPTATFRRSIAIVVVSFVYSLLGTLVLLWVNATLPPNELALAAGFAVLVLLAVLFFIILLIKYLFRLNTLRSMMVLLGHLAAGGVILLGVIFLINPYVLQAYIASSNSMAPTLIAEHRVAACPACGQTVYLPAGARGFVLDRGICSHCLKVSQIETTKIYADVIQPDRIFVAKLLKPSRWDVVAYRSTQEPDLLVVSRLVALPGEKVQIKDGSVWINGTRLTPPADIAALRYLADAWQPDSNESQEILLQANEGYVLGDFSEHSFDSRRAGPVPMTNIVGVVDLIYWPWNRIRILR